MGRSKLEREKEEHGSRRSLHGYILTYRRIFFKCLGFTEQIKTTEKKAVVFGPNNREREREREGEREREREAEADRDRQRQTETDSAHTKGENWI